MSIPSFQLDEFYLDLQENSSSLTWLNRESIEFCPFPGLRPFRTSEFQLFKGREGQADELLQRLQKNHFLAVIGSSGTGKSSLIRAGLIPQLYGGYLYEAGSKWNIAICRPGRAPLENLSIALSSIKCQSRNKDKILAEYATITPVLHKSVYGILEVNQLLQREKDGIQKNLLIIIDQFEELFRFDQKKTDNSHFKNHFVNLLLKASAQFDSSVYVIITMRSEFLGECVKYRGLPEVINDGQYLVPQLGRSQVKDVIEGPLKLAGRQIDAGLSSILLNEIEETRLKDNLDQLPILQHALMRTYKHASFGNGNTIIHQQDYIAIGGMERALALHAEAKYNELGEAGQAADAISRKQLIAQIVFQALTDLSSEQKGGRRPVELANIYAITHAIGASEEETNEVINKFRDIDTSFIMPPVNTPLVPSLIIDISHESLMRNWERLNNWMLEEVWYGERYYTLNDRRILHEREEGEHNELRGILLKELIKWRDIPYHNSAWAARYHKKEDGKKAVELFKKNIKFLQYCEEQYETAKKQEKYELEQKIRAEQQYRSNRRIMWITSIAAGVAIMLLGVAFFSMRDAIKNKAIAERKALETRKKMFEIYLRDSTDWWEHPLLNTKQRQRVVNTLFELYDTTNTHIPSHLDSIAGKRLEISLRMLKRAFNNARLTNWGNYLHLLKAAKDFDPNFVTSAVLDSMLSMTLPVDKYCILNSADRPDYEEAASYRMTAIHEKGNASVMLLSKQGITQYYFDGRFPKTRCAFNKPYKPLAINRDGTKAIVASGIQLFIYEQDPVSGSWQINVPLSKQLSEPAKRQPIPVIHDTEYYVLAAFSDDGNRLAVYNEYFECNLFQLSNGNLQKIKTAGDVRKLVFNHNNNRLLIGTPDSALLVNVNTTPATITQLFIKKKSGQTRTNIYLADWSFASDDAFVYAWADSTRYAWATGKGQYNGLKKINIDYAERYVPVYGDTMLFTKNKDEISERNIISEKGTFICLYDGGSSRKCFPWHNSPLQFINVGPNGMVISCDTSVIYLWHRQSRPLDETGIDQYIDKQSLSDYYGEMGFDKRLALNEAENIAYYKKATHYGSTYPGIWNMVGNYYLNSPTPDSALPYFRQAIALSPRSTYFSNLGKLFYKLSLYDSALVYAFQAMQMEPLNGKLWNDVARIYYSTNRITEAINYYHQAIKLAPTDNTILNNLVDVYIEIKQSDSAMVYLNKALIINSSDPKVWTSRARYFNRINNYAAAQKNADSAIRLGPEYNRGYAELGYAYLKTGKLIAGLKVINKAALLDSSDYVSYIYVTCYYALQNDKQAAIEFLQKAIDKGFRQWNWVDNERAFDGIRNDKTFKELRRVYYR